MRDTVTGRQRTYSHHVHIGAAATAPVRRARMWEAYENRTTTPQEYDIPAGGAMYGDMQMWKTVLVGLLLLGGIAVA